VAQLALARADFDPLVAAPDFSASVSPGTGSLHRVPFDGPLLDEPGLGRAPVADGIEIDVFPGLGVGYLPFPTSG
jgi:hypothetical protein